MFDITKTVTGKIRIEDRLIISIDVSTKQELMELCCRISNKVSTVKLGLELIYSCGPGIVQTARNFGYHVMLDAKLHDIPNTVSKAASAITRLGVDKITLHASGGIRMLMDAKRTVLLEAERMNILPPLIFGVTVLTSLDDSDLTRIGYASGYEESVVRLAGLAIESGLDGLICSPGEVAKIRRRFGSGLLIATPGIRLEEDSHDDQKRVSTPYAAIKNGADYVIAGRSVTSKKNTVEIIDKILDEIERAIK